MADEQKEAVRNPSKEDPRLPGEHPDTRVGSDAAHWIEIYAELRRINLRVIENLKAMTQSQSNAVTSKVQRSHLDVLEQQLQIFERRLAFWQRRLAELDGHSNAGETGSSKPE
jgi:hypothetical protein